MNRCKTTREGILSCSIEMRSRPFLLFLIWKQRTKSFFFLLALAIIDVLSLTGSNNIKGGSLCLVGAWVCRGLYWHSACTAKTEFL